MNQIRWFASLVLSEGLPDHELPLQITDGVSEMETDLSASWRSFIEQPEEEGFRVLYDAAAPLVYTICLRITRCRDDAEDAFQGTFCRLIAEARERPRGDARKLISRTAVREADALSKRRNRRHRREASMDHIQSSEAAGNPDAQTLRLTVEQVVERLPDELRVPVLLHYFDGLTHKEIADALNVSRPAITHRLKRALNALEPELRAAGIQNVTAAFTVVAAGASLLLPSSGLGAPAIWSTAQAASVETSGAAVIAGIGGKMVAAVAAGILVIASAGIIARSSGSFRDESGRTSNVAFEGEPEYAFISNSTGKNTEGKKTMESLEASEPETKDTLPSETGDKVAPETVSENEVKHARTAPWLIQGMVTDSEGNPLPGIFVRHAGLGYSRLDADTTTRTRPDGSFSLWLAEDKTTRLAAFGKGYAPFWLERVKPGEREAPLDVDIMLERGRTLRGRVVDDKGRGIQDVRVIARGRNAQNFIGFPGQERARFMTGEEGGFVIPDVPSGEISVFLQKAGYSSADEIVAVAEPQTLTLPDGTILSGEVIDGDTGAPVKAFEMDLRHEDRTLVVSDPRGIFVIPGLDGRKKYDLAVSAEGYEPLRLKDQETYHPQDPQPLTIKLYRGTVMTVELMDAETGDPLPDAKLLTGLWRENYRIDWKELRENFVPENDWWNCTICDIVRTSTDLDGVAAFVEGNQPRMIAIWTPGYERKIIHPNEREDWLVDDDAIIVPLARSATVEVLADWDGSLQSGQDLHITPWPPMGGGITYETYTTGDDGLAVWDSLPPGEYTVEALRSERGFHHGWLRRRIEVIPGETKRVSLAEGLGAARMVGVVLPGRDDDLPDLHAVRLHPFDEPGLTFQAAVDSLGNFSFSRLPEGNARLEASLAGGDIAGKTTLQNIERHLAIENEGEIELTFEPLPPIKTASVQVTFPDGPDLGGWTNQKLEFMPVPPPKTGELVNMGMNLDWFEVVEGKAEVTILSEIGDEFQLVVRGVSPGPGSVDTRSFILLLPGRYSVPAKSQEFDLGPVPLPVLRATKVTMEMTEEIEPGEVALLATSTDGTRFMTGMKQLSGPIAGTHTLRFLPAGFHRLTPLAPGIAFDPPSADIGLHPGTMPEIRFLLRTSLLFVGGVQDQSTSEPLRSISRITLTGGDFRKVITPDDAVEEASRFVTTAGNLLLPEYGLFRFGDLPPERILTLKVEAQGYEPGVHEFNTAELENRQSTQIIQMQRTGTAVRGH